MSAHRNQSDGKMKHKIGQRLNKKGKVQSLNETKLKKHQYENETLLSYSDVLGLSIDCHKKIECEIFFIIVAVDRLKLSALVNKEMAGDNRYYKFNWTAKSLDEERAREADSNYYNSHQSYKLV